MARAGMKGWQAAVLSIGCALAVGCGSPSTPTHGNGQNSQGGLNAQVLEDIVPSKSLVITDLSVVEDPVRTAYVPGVTDASDPRGVWSFGRLMENLAGGSDPSSFVLNWLRQWETDQSVGGFVSPARPAIRTLVTDPWRTASGCAPGSDPCQLDLGKAPFRLLAITNRLDLRDLDNSKDKVNSAGEGRFIFGALRPDGTPLVFTVIFEFEQQAKKSKDVLAWASAWNSLNGLEFGAAFNARLQDITQNFAGKGIAKDKPGGSALGQLRTNEASLAPAGSDPDNLPSTKLWELREFRIGSGGQLAQSTVKQNPDLSLNGSSTLGSWVAANEAAVISGKFAVPDALLGASALTPKALKWTVPGVSEAARSSLALNTCSGCHLSETGTGFLHIGRRAPGVAAPLSSWLIGQLDLRSSDLAGVLDAGKKGEKIKEGKRKNGLGAAD